MSTELFKLGLRIIDGEKPTDDMIKIILNYRPFITCSELLLFLYVGFYVRSELLIFHMLQELKKENCSLNKIISNSYNFNIKKRFEMLAGTSDSFLERSVAISITYDIFQSLIESKYYDIATELSSNEIDFTYDIFESPAIESKHDDMKYIDTQLDLLISYGFSIKNSENFLTYTHSQLFTIEQYIISNPKLRHDINSLQYYYTILKFISKYLNIIEKDYPHVNNVDSPYLNIENLINKFNIVYTDFISIVKPVYIDFNIEDLYPMISSFKNINKEIVSLPKEISKKIMKDYILPIKYCERCGSTEHHSDFHRKCKFCSSYEHASIDCIHNPDKKNFFKYDDNDISDKMNSDKKFRSMDGKLSKGNKQRKLSKTRKRNQQRKSSKTRKSNKKSKRRKRS